MKIGVVLITYRRPAMLRQALRSLAHQTRIPDEVLISDNSPDPDAGVVKEFPNLAIRYRHHDRHFPPETHWLWALQQPETDFVSLLEDDNLYGPRHLELLSDGLAASPSAVLAGSNAMVFQDLISAPSGPIFAPLWKIDLLESHLPRLIPRDLALATFLLGSPFASSATMFRREKLAGYKLEFSGMPISYDRWMWAQIVSHGDVVYCPQTTVLYRDHPIQLVKRHRRAVHRADTCRCTFLILDLLKRLGLRTEKLLPELLAGFHLPERISLGYLVFRQRNLALFQTLMPLILPDLGWMRQLQVLFVYMAKVKLKRRLSLS